MKIFTIGQGVSSQHFTHSDNQIIAFLSNSTSARSKLHCVLSVILQKIGNERKEEKQKKNVFLRSRYSPCLAEDCEVFRIPPGAGDPVCRAAAPWPTTQNQRGELTLKCCLPAMQPGSRVSTGIAIPLERVMVVVS